MATTKKTAAREGPDAYAARIATDAVDTERFVVSVLVMRRDGKPMTEEDLAAAAAAYPRAEVVGSSLTVAPKKPAARPRKRAA
jgi:hypothetical protein